MSGFDRDDVCDDCCYIYGVIVRAEIPRSLRSRAVEFRTRLDRLEEEVLRAHRRFA